jgi:predicted nucleic acid-binding protein
VTRLLVDTSVLIKWFHSHGESEVPQASALRTAHLNGGLEAHVLDLAYYELGNVLIRALGWTAGDVADQLDDLTTILGPPLVMTAPWLRQAAELAHTHTLSFYDAAWAAAAHELAIPLVSADRQLLAAGLAQTPADIATRLNLPTT